MRQTGIDGSPRNRFNDNSKIYHPETKQDFCGQGIPGHIYESHLFLSISPKGRKEKIQISFGKVCYSFIMIFYIGHKRSQQCSKTAYKGSFPAND